ncbi:MAG: PD-(D/E)XK motif protein [Staphylococcus sp.]|nr:PD-(D/E)XK motif protein [Staphylococcus sp.]
MINLFEKFNSLNRNIKNTQYLIDTKGVVKAYYGVSVDGFFRLAFLSSKSSGIKDMTKNIAVVQGNSNEENYWTCFDLKNDDLISVFCSFGEDLISSVCNEYNETTALTKLRLRYSTWLALFRKTRTPLSPEKAKGLFGELYFLKNVMLKKYDIDKTINSWSGPDYLVKDFAVDDYWYEIKTISCSGTVVKISSLQQLSSDIEGKLVVIKVEEMADAYKGKDSSINELVQYVIAEIESNDTKDMFLDKLANIGYDFSDELGNKKYNVANLEYYLVDDKFPALRETDIKSEAINNVGYELILKLLIDYLVK